MAIEKEIVDRLLANYEKPEDLTGENGVLRQLTKALMERALEAEMAHVRGCNSANRCNVENASLQVRVLLSVSQRNRHHAGAAGDIQYFAVLRKIEITRQRLGISLVQVEQHLGEVFRLARVPLHTFRVIRLGAALDLVISFARGQGLLQIGERLVVAHALLGGLPRPVDGALGDEVLLRKLRVPVAVILFVQQSQRGHHVKKGQEIEFVELEGLPDLRGGHGFVVQGAKQLQPLRRDDQAREDEGPLYVNFRQDAFGELVEGRYFHPRDHLGWSLGPATSTPLHPGPGSFNLMRHRDTYRTKSFGLTPVFSS